MLTPAYVVLPLLVVVAVAVLDELAAALVEELAIDATGEGAPVATAIDVEAIEVSAGTTVAIEVDEGERMEDRVVAAVKAELRVDDFFMQGILFSFFAVLFSLTGTNGGIY